MRAILIDANAQEINEYKNTGLESLQKAVDGYIAIGHTFDNGDTLWVNDEGIWSNNHNLFKLAGACNLFIGNAVITGGADAQGNTLSAKSTIRSLRKNITFLLDCSHLINNQG